MSSYTNQESNSSIMPINVVPGGLKANGLTDANAAAARRQGQAGAFEQQAHKRLMTSRDFLLLTGVDPYNFGSNTTAENDAKYALDEVT